MRAELERIDGFISVERFQSLTDPDKLLSLSFWRDEDAVARWRNELHHRESAGRGRGGIFADYRLRIASVVRDYGINEREQRRPTRAFITKVSERSGMLEHDAREPFGLVDHDVVMGILSHIRRP